MSLSALVLSSYSPIKAAFVSQLRALAGQTAVYGLSSIIGRLLNYLLVPLYTRIFSPAEFGVVSEFYAYITFLSVLYTYGMETAFFHFVNRKPRHEHVYGHAQFLLLCTTLLFTLPLLLFAGPAADALGYASHPEYIRWIALILAFDTLSSLPFARLRQQNKALRFAIIKLGGIFINIALNLYFLWYLPKIGSPLYDPGMGAGYVFLANLAASALTWIMLVRETKEMRPGIPLPLLKEMMIYSLPLLIAGFAGMINETLDRAILKYLIKDPSIALEQLGIYSACYKLSIVMTLFVQTFRFAAEPFYFSRQHKDDSRRLFAAVMDYFVMAGCIIFLGVMFYLDIFKLFIGERYYGGLHVVPLLLAANLFLGIYLNLSIWYKLTGKTGYGAWLSVMGAVITVVLNLWLIPQFGIMGAAWATLVCYALMMVLSYLKGRIEYPVPYHVPRIAGMMTFTGLLWGASIWTRSYFPLTETHWWGIHAVILAAYFGVLWRFLGGKKQLPLFD